MELPVERKARRCNMEKPVEFEGRGGSSESHN